MNTSDNSIDRLQECNNNINSEAICFDCKWSGSQFDIYRQFIEDKINLTIKYHCPKCKSEKLGVRPPQNQL